MSALAPGWVRRVLDRVVPGEALSGWRLGGDFLGERPVLYDEIGPGRRAAIVRGGAAEAFWLHYHRSRLERLA